MTAEPEEMQTMTTIPKMHTVVRSYLQASACVDMEAKGCSECKT